jgi:hypothetical protein
MNLISKCFFAALGLGVTLSSQAGLVNPGFELGTLNSWTFTPNGGSAAVVSSQHSILDSYTYQPQDGSHFLAITSGDVGGWVTVSRTFSLNVGDLVKVWAGFDYGDKMAAPEAQWTWQTVPQWQKNAGSADLQDHHTPWAPWSTTIAAAGNYTLEFQVRANDEGDDISRGLFDVSITPVPEPSTWVSGVFLASLTGSSLFSQYKRRKKS